MFQKNKELQGSGIRQLAFLDKATDTVHGRTVYEMKCAKYHGQDGKRVLNKDSSVYLYPPLWGKNSYTAAAGLYRLRPFVGYIKDNIPFGATYQATQLTHEEAWDIAAYINSRPHRQRIFKQDWPDISLKPVDYPFPPYADNFSEKQHKYGPFATIQEAAKTRGPEGGLIKRRLNYKHNNKL